MREMRLLAIDDVRMEDLRLAELPFIINTSDQVGFGIQSRQGISGDVFFGGLPEPATWRLVFKFLDLDTQDAVFAVLAGDVTEQRRLLATRSDVEKTPATIQAAVTNIRTRAGHHLEVEMRSSSAVWLSASSRETSKIFTSTLDQAMHITVPGNTRTAPRVILTPTVQRGSSGTTRVGSRFRRRYVVTNLSDEPMYNYPLRISLGDTTPLTTTKAQTDGDDVLVVIDGIERQRTLVTWDTTDSHLWCIVDALPAGESMTVEVWYGNAAATNPPALAYPNLPPFVLTSSTNALWGYLVLQVAANAGRGLWWLSADSLTALADFTVPGAWRPVLTLDVPQNHDVHIQNVLAQYVHSGGTHSMAILNAVRGPSDGTAVGLATTGQGFDGVGITSPIPITSIRSDFRWFNDAHLGTFVILIRDSSASRWAVRGSTTAATTGGSDDIALTTYAMTPAVKQVSIAVWPNNFVYIPDVSDGSPDTYAQVQFITTLEVALDSSKISITGGAEEEIYELATELRIGGGPDWVAPYRSILVGNARGESGEGTPRCGILLTEALVIDGGTFAHNVYLADLSAKVELVSAHAVRPVVGFDSDGLTMEGPGNLFLPLAPARTRVPNGAFDADIGSWIVGTVTAGVTATRSWDGAIGGDLVGSLKVAITPNTAGTGAQAEAVSARYFPINGRESVDIAAWVRSSSASITPRLRINWYDDDQTLLSASTETDWTPVINTPYRRTFAARVPPLATQYRIVLLTYIDGAAATGNVWFDDITTGGVELIVSDVAMGGLNVTVQTQGRWLA